MQPLRYGLLVLFLLAPALAAAQLPDSVDVLNDGDTFGAWGANFGPQFVIGNEIGPLELVQVEGDGTSAPPEMGCDPLTNADEIEGNIAFVLRGYCAFVLKVQHAAAAGAEAVIVYNDDRNGDLDPSLVQMGGDCGLQDGCTIPAAFISRQSFLEITTDWSFGEEATIVPIRVTRLPPEPPVNHLYTGIVRTTIFEDGFIGHDASFGSGPGLTFNDQQGLFVSSVLVGQVVGADTVVNANPYVGFSEFDVLQDGASIAPPFAPPFDAFDGGGRVWFASPLGVAVTLTGYADRDEPNRGFIAFELEVENISDYDLDDLYLGIFADFDTGTTTSTDDAGGFNESLKLAYVYDPVETYPYFGVAVLDVDALSGYSLDAGTLEGSSDGGLFAALTSDNPPVPDPGERAAVTGIGPFDLAPGEIATARFAFVAGEDEADLFANARAAQRVFEVAVEEAAPEGSVVLDAVYPNPFSEHATIGFTLPRAQAVWLAVYDVLGREVAVLADGVRPAGEQAMTLDAAGLPSGVYVVRLDAGGVQLAQRLTVVR